MIYGKRKKSTEKIADQVVRQPVTRRIWCPPHSLQQRACSNGENSTDSGRLWLRMSSPNFQAEESFNEGETWRIILIWS